MKVNNTISNISDIIGRTPMYDLSIKNRNWKLYLKLEKFNPGQSMKDRMALNMILQYEKDGLLKKGGSIVESSSGNTGVSLAMIAAERGYRFLAVVDHHAANDKIAIMQSYGAKVIYVQGDYAENQVAVKERESLAKKISEQTPNSVFIGQADNMANSDGYYRTLGPEIYHETGGGITAYIGAVGTGGSLCGTAKYLKERKPTIKVIGIEPNGSIIFDGLPSPYYQSGTGTPGGVKVGNNVCYSVIDSGQKVEDSKAFTTARFLAKTKGLLVGGASGGVIYKALEYLHNNSRIDEGLMVALIADGGERYLDTIFNDEWMQNRGLIDTIAIDNLIKWIDC